MLNENMGPCLAVSGDTVHAVWSDHRSSGFAIYYTHSVDTGITWSAPVNITDTSGRATFPAIAVSGATVHVVWMDSLLGIRASYYKRSLDGGNTWGPNVVLDSNTAFWPGVAAWGQMVVVSLNKLVAVGNTEVFFMRSTDNGATWDPEQQISNAPNRSEDPAINVLGQDVHLSWNDKRTGTMQIYYRHSPDAGITWDAETQLTNAVAPNNCYTTMVSLNGQHTDVPYGYNMNGIFNVWLAQSSDTGVTWIANGQVSYTANGAAYPYMVRDGMHLHLVYPQFGAGGTGGPRYIHSGDGGVTWDSTVSLGAGGQPFIAYTGCVLHVIFGDSGKVYYTRNPTGNSANCIATGVENSADMHIGFNLYPNPANGNFTLTYPATISEASFTITDVAGRVVYHDKIKGGSGKYFADVNLSAGIYYWQISSSGGIVSKGKAAVMK